MLIEECPDCGAYVSTDDGQDDAFVVHKVCEPCRKREESQSFDDGFAEYEESQRIDREDELNLGAF